MTLDGAPYAPQSPADGLAAGVAIIHQELRLLPELSVAENVFIGAYPTRGGRVDRDAMREAASTQLRRLGLDINPDIAVGRLSVAAQQRVEVAKALHRNPRYMILDEPTAPLGEDETRDLFAQMDRLRAEGHGMIYITHRLEEVRQVADRIVVMRDGQRVADWDYGNVPIEDIVQAMVGRDVGHRFPVAPTGGAETVLRARGLTRVGAFEDVSFDVHRGEILGIAGLVGSGRTEVVRAVFGADRLDAGTIEVDGGAVRFRSPADAVRHGIVLIPEDRKVHGAILSHTVADNLALPSLDGLTKRGILRKALLRANADDLIGRLRIKARPDQEVGMLSGGNQQKAVIAKWLPQKPRIMLFDEPTRGVDVGARPSIYDEIRELADHGTSVILVSSELEEVLGLSTRVMVMSRGRLAGILSREEATPERVMTLASHAGPEEPLALPGLHTDDAAGGEHR
jgi:ribose transport system ATP-binding protein